MERPCSPGRAPTRERSGGSRPHLTADARILDIAADTGAHRSLVAKWVREARPAARCGRMMRVFCETRTDRSHRHQCRGDAGDAGDPDAGRALARHLGAAG